MINVQTGCISGYDGAADNKVYREQSSAPLDPFEKLSVFSDLGEAPKNVIKVRTRPRCRHHQV